MKLKMTGLLMAIAMMLGVAALPAAAAVDAHVGVFQATADVGKNGTCDTQGAGNVSGGSIGLLPLDVKNAWWRITAGTVVDVPSGLGVAQLCGRLSAPLQGTVPGVDPKELPVPIGASCAATKGWGGYGKATLGGPVKPVTLYIKDLGWKATLGGTFIVTGDADTTKGGGSGLLLAAVQTLNNNVIISCINKSVDGDKSDPAPFLVAAAYSVIPGAGAANDPMNKAPKK